MGVTKFILVVVVLIFSFFVLVRVLGGRR